MSTEIMPETVESAYPSSATTSARYVPSGRDSDCKTAVLSLEGKPSVESKVKVQSLEVKLTSFVEKDSFVAVLVRVTVMVFIPLSSPQLPARVIWPFLIAETSGDVMVRVGY